ncbi:DnaJ domain-containing protein [Chroococcidiopsis thermalis]|uniref:Heat shock protein DnaJ domain protein n=1 Tax=Chroococcidiopsis thermalis (strain PCC 7203) TaxID=251229 RepID=K9TXG6_CHRTP|nr:DnaJ domain-containing protein [Chroococcidiopsis thermalis]AFY86689.1 heat shock protein DnaJ domain protein [Chroococcidiopsis thermalis PCC 7203]
MITTVAVEPEFGTVEWITYKVRRAEADLYDVALFLWRESLAHGFSFSKMVEQYRQQGADIPCSNRTLSRYLEALPDYQQHQEHKRLNPSPGALRKRKHDEKNRYSCHDVKSNDESFIDVEAVEIQDREFTIHPIIIEPQPSSESALAMVRPAIDFSYFSCDIQEHTKTLIRIRQLEEEFDYLGKKKYVLGTGEWWQILKVNRSATKVEVVDRYRELLRFWHPDINKSSEAEENTKLINSAWSSFEKEMNVECDKPNPRSVINDLDTLQKKVAINIQELNDRVTKTYADMYAVQEENKRLHDENEKLKCRIHELENEDSEELLQMSPEVALVNLTGGRENLTKFAQHWLQTYITDMYGGTGGFIVFKIGFGGLLETSVEYWKTKRSQELTEGWISSCGLWGENEWVGWDYDEDYDDDEDYDQENEQVQSSSNAQITEAEIQQEPPIEVQIIPTEVITETPTGLNGVELRKELQRRFGEDRVKEQYVINCCRKTKKEGYLIKKVFEDFGIKLEIAGKTKLGNLYRIVDEAA